MTAHFFRNLYLASDLTEEQLKDIPNPRAELHYHVLNKNLQLGCLLGGFIGSLRGLIKHKSLKAMIQVGYKGQRLGCLLLAPAAPVQTELMLNAKKASEDSIYDRSYRIRCNQNQTRVDRYAGYSAVLGVSTSLILKKSLLPGLITGYTLGTIAGGVHNHKLSNDTKE